MFAVVRVESGILEGVTLFEDREKALRFGRDEFQAMLGPDPMGDYAETNDPDYDPEWGGVARGFVMHWGTDDDDVWVTEPSQPVGQLTTVVGEEGSGKTRPGKE